MTSEPFTLRWGILATGGIAKTFAKDLLIDPSTRSATDIHHLITAAASSTSQSRARDFLHEVNAPTSASAYGSYTDLVADPNVDIIYIATPHSHHYQHTRLALNADKHVLVEKPITVNAAQARALYALAREKNLFCMEAVWTRFLPLTLSVQKFIASGRLGVVKRVCADLSFWNNVEAEFGTRHRMVNMDLAGGALLDLGVYSLTWVFLVLWHLQRAGEREFSVRGAVSKYRGTGCDEMTSVLLDFPGAGVGDVGDALNEESDESKDVKEGKARDNGDAHAIALTNIRVSHNPNSDHPVADPVRIQGTLGDITVSPPSYLPPSYTLIPAKNDSRGQLTDWEYETKTFKIPGGGHGMFWEADECARCIRDGKLESEVMGWEESVAVMEVMDEVRRQGELQYPESIESVQYPLDGFGI